jgi:hypothetical protein
MICILSPYYRTAKLWADTQNLNANEWFYCSDETDVTGKSNFHVLVIGEFDQQYSAWFEKLYSLAKKHGKTR